MSRRPLLEQSHVSISHRAPDVTWRAFEPVQRFFEPLSVGLLSSVRISNAFTVVIRESSNTPLESFPR